MKKGGKALILALVLCLISAIGAFLLQTDFGKVQVTEMTLPGSDGAEVSGILYKPVSATADNPLPLIIAAHGSFNNKEMQDQNLVELSRRGYIVFAPDSYRHGESSIHNENMGEYQSLVDSVEALYDLNYVDSSKVALIGHSMGADQSNNTVKYYITQAALGKETRKIAAILSVGCDPAYASYTVDGLSDPVPVTVNYGVIEAKYDEWFFKQEDTNNDPARYLESQNAKNFIEEVGVTVTGAVENGKIYEGEINGENYVRVIYQNPEIHPLNTFSHKSAADAVEFFYKTLGVPNGYQEIDKDNQVWFAKEVFNGIGLVGIFLFLFPFAQMLMKTKFFSDISSETEEIEQPALSGNRKIGFWVTAAINAAIPAILLMPIGFKLIGQETFVPAIYNKLFGEANTNELAGWSAVSALVILAVEIIYYKTIGKKNGSELNGWGYKASAKQIWKSLLLALITVAAVYLIVFTVNYFFCVDYRFWVIAVQPFDAMKLQYFLVYLPGFAIFYLVNCLVTSGCNNIKGWKEWQKMLLGCVCNIAGLAVLVWIQYAGIFKDGSDAFNCMRIVNLFPLFVLIPAATLVSRKFYKKTHNIYLGSFVISMLYCMVTVSNTMFMAHL